MPIDHPRGAVYPGPFLTRREAARIAGVAPGTLAAMPGAIRIDGPLSLEEVYPQFEFAAGGGRLDAVRDLVAGEVRRAA